MKFLGTAARIAWRELKATPSRFIFVVLAVAVGVGALSGVKGFGSAFRSMLFRNAKQLTASDVTAQVWGLPTDDQLRRLRRIGRRAGALTWVTETISMAARPGNPTPQMVAVKAVDPSVYPFYGQLTLQPAAPLRALLSGNDVLVNEELMIRLHLKRGDALRLGGQHFRLAGTIVTEPDRLASGFGPSMRIMMSRESLARTGLIQLGSRASQRFLFRVRPDVDLGRLKADVGSVLTRPRFTDFRDGDPAIERGINRSTTFLSLVSLVALIVGSLGVGMAMYSHLQQKMDTIAVMKAVGARSRQIVTIYLIQTLWLGLAGGVLGVALGALVQKMFPILIHQVFALLPEVSWDWSFSLQGLAVGVLATLLFTLPPIIGVWNVRPSLVFRREMNDAQRKPVWQSLSYIACLAAIAAGFIGISLWLSGSWQVSSYFVGGLAASLVLLGIVATLLLAGARWLVRRSGRTLPANFRHGFANLYRPGTHAASILVALGVGVVFITTTYLIQKAIIRDVQTDAPSRSGNVYLLDIRPGQREEVARFIAAQPGVEKAPELVGYFVARLIQKNNKPIESLPLPKRKKDQLQTSRLSVVDEFPANFELTSGRFWARGTREPRVAISEEEAQRFGFQVGDRLQFQAAGKLITAPVVATYHPTKRAAFRFEVLYPREAMGTIPAVYFGSAQVRPADIPALEGAIFEKFPTITVMNLADILQRIQQAVEQVALVIRFLAAFAIVAGIVILCSSVAGTRYRRMREVAVLKTLGGTRRRITAIFSVEFTILGAVAGFIGGLLANAFTRVITTKYIEIPFQYDPVAVVAAMVLMAVLANAAGWLASLRILDLRPLEVLRAE
jgi:putative ABC transport system permease protein